MTNINIELFKRYQPDKKIEIIKKLTDEEVRMVSKATVLRIIHEAGQGRKKSSYKTIRLEHELGGSNNWNSTVNSIYTGKNHSLWLEVYMQSDHTDQTDCVPYEEFFGRGEYVGSMTELDRYGHDKYFYARYDWTDKTGVLRDFLYTYVIRKYAGKLKKETA